MTTFNSKWTEIDYKWGCLKHPPADFSLWKGKDGTVREIHQQPGEENGEYVTYVRSNTPDLCRYTIDALDWVEWLERTQAQTMNKER